ncbi:bifunctional adenosylcobinamide kinase/adenosylcobinamide-phosphate guanylyltransferase [Salinifilum aidingensis]
MAEHALVLGGARSGKSAHAEGLVSAADRVDYVATARQDPADGEWTARIEQHRARRPEHWRTVEAPDSDALARALRTSAADRTVLVDDMATWLTGVLDDTGAWDREDAALRRVERHRAAVLEAARASPSNLVFVSAEVGLGVVPGTRAGRLFRDELGASNAQLAELCARVELLVAGVPLRLR